MEIALTEKKILIVEAYLRNPKDKTTAVREVDPSIKSPSAYAWKLFNELEVKEYLVARRLELLKESAITTKELVKGVSTGLRQSLGLEERVIFDGITLLNQGIYPDSGDAKNYYSILERILGSEISGALAQKDLLEERKLVLKSKDVDTKTTVGKENLRLKNEKLKKELLEDEMKSSKNNEIELEY